MKSALQADQGFKDVIKESKNKPEANLKLIAGTPMHRQSICVTCAHSAGCMYLAGAKEAIRYCEEFETLGGAPVQTRLQSPSEEPAKKTLQGLCCNCESSKGCTFSKPEGGIWHCEEYR